jgi:hypothetical protein
MVLGLVGCMAGACGSGFLFESMFLSIRECKWGLEPLRGPSVARASIGAFAFGSHCELAGWKPALRGFLAALEKWLRCALNFLLR